MRLGMYMNMMCTANANVMLRTLHGFLQPACRRHSEITKRTVFNRRTPVTPKTYQLVLPGNVSPQMPPSKIPSHIPLPPYATTGIPPIKPDLPDVKSIEEQQRMRSACQLAREILKGAGEMVQPGVTTEHIDQYVFNACISNDAYPSPLNYRGFPKSVCTSVNNVVCHGIPDDRSLTSGDIINIDITVFIHGVHGDCSETFLVGDVDQTGTRLVEVAKECRDVGVSVCGPDTEFRKIGQEIEKYALSKGFQVVPAFTGHGIGSYFHGPPDIFHQTNSYPGKMKPGMTFTVEPAISEGGFHIVILEDGWTAVTEDNSRSAQFEHTVLITEHGVDILTK